MALGAGSVTPLQMATAYSVFANGGYRLQPQLIERVTDHKGRLLLEARPELKVRMCSTADGSKNLAAFWVCA